MIFRLLILFLIVLFLIWIIRKQLLSRDNVHTTERNESVEDMIACARCGTHVPKSLAIEHSGKSYCCKEHAEQDE